MYARGLIKYNLSWPTASFFICLFSGNLIFGKGLCDDGVSIFCFTFEDLIIVYEIFGECTDVGLD